MNFCPSCLHHWTDNDNPEVLKANGIQCKYCKTFFIDSNFVLQVLRENGIKHINFDFRHIGDHHD